MQPRWWWWTAGFSNLKSTFTYTRLATMDIHRSSYEMERKMSAMNNYPGFSPHRAMATSPHSAYSNASDYNTPNTLLARRYSYVNPHRPWYRRLYKSMQNCTKKFMESHTRKGVKYINANKHVLSTYHDSFLYGEFPVFVGVRAAMRTGTIGHIWTTVEFLLAALSGILHVYSTYHLKNIEDYEWIPQAQNVASCIFVADYVLRLYCEPVRILYVFSYWGLIDLLSAMPIIFVFKIISVFSDIGIVGSTLYQKILLVAMTTLGAVFLSAGIMQWIESEIISTEEKLQCPTSGCLDFLDAFYYIIVTVATVGYGDISPKTVLGKICAVAIIIAALIYIPLQVSRINSLASLRPYGGSFSSRKVMDARYIILTGSISYQAVQDCLAEFYSSTHCDDNFAYPLRVNILAPFQPSYELKNLLALYNGLVEFIEGSPVYQSDLERVCATQATAIFILANKATNNTKAEDAIQVIRALAVHRTCGHQVRIIVEVLDPNTQTSAVWDETESGRIEIICPAKLHYKMLSRSCIIRGLYTFIGNLFTSKIKLTNDSEYEFLTEFFHSYDNEIYPVILPSSYHNLTFEEAADHIYLSFDSILFALDVPIKHKSKTHVVNKVLLYPKGHIIEPDDVGLLISRDIQTAFAISNQGNQGLQKRLCGKDTIPKSYHAPPDLIQIEEPVESVIDRWKRTGTVTTLNTNRDSINPNGASSSDIDIDTRAFPLNPDGAYKLETQLRSAIHESQLDGLNSPMNEPNTIDKSNSAGLQNWLNKSYENVALSNQSNVDVEVESRTSSVPIVVKKKSLHSMSLEKETEKLLTWPPLSTYGQPHPVVLERRADTILKDLKEKTLSIVEMAEPHILLCCQGTWPSHLFYFVKGLRQPKNRHPPIVILFPKEPSADQWGLVGIFKDVFLIKGSPIFELDLMRGGVLQAEKVVIFANLGASISNLTAQQVQDTRYQTQVKSTYISDVDNILVASNVDRLLGDKASFVLMVEMQHTIGFDYLRPQFGILRSRADEFCSHKDYSRNRDALLHLGPPFMEGRATSPILLGFLMRSTFYNRNTVSIVEQIVDGGFVEENGCLSDDRYARRFEQIAVHERYANRPYVDLFMGLLHREEKLAMGLYRTKGTLGCPTSYVLTNPPKDCIVNAMDMVYIFS